MHCNSRPPEPRQPFPALIATPCQVWSRWTYPLPYYSVFVADKLLYAVTLTLDPVTLTGDLWPWTFAVWCDKTLCQIWTQSSNPRRSYSNFNIWPHDLILTVALWFCTVCSCLNVLMFRVQSSIELLYAINHSFIHSFINSLSLLLQWNKLVNTLHWACCQQSPSSSRDIFAQLDGSALVGVCVSPLHPSAAAVPQTTPSPPSASAQKITLSRLDCRTIN